MKIKSNFILSFIVISLLPFMSSCPGGGNTTPDAQLSSSGPPRMAWVIKFANYGYETLDEMNSFLNFMEDNCFDEVIVSARQDDAHSDDEAEGNHNGVLWYEKGMSSYWMVSDDGTTEIEIDRGRQEDTDGNPYSPFDEFLKKAKERNIKVWAWFPVTLDKNAGQTLPQWLQVKSEGTVSADRLCPSNAQARAYMADVLDDFLQNYSNEIEGVILDHIRYESEDHCHCEDACETSEKAGNTDYKCNQVATLVESLANICKGYSKPVGAFVLPPIDDIPRLDKTNRLHGQDYAKMLDAGLDFIAPMYYFDDWGPVEYISLIMALAGDEVGRSRIHPTIPGWSGGDDQYSVNEHELLYNWNLNQYSDVIFYVHAQKDDQSSYMQSMSEVYEHSCTMENIDDIMANTKLIERVSTGATIDLVSVASDRNGIQIGDFVIWSKSLDTYGDGNWWSKFPSVSLKFAINSSGDFFVGAIGDDADALSVLTEGGLKSSYSATWGYPIESGDLIVHDLLNDGPTANVLVNILYSEFLGIAESGWASGGPELVYAVPYGSEGGSALLGFTGLDFSLYNNFGSDITVIMSALYMSQSTTEWACGCPCDGIAFEDGPSWLMHDALNKKWNPKSVDTQDGSGTRGFDIDVSGDAVFYSARSDGDNQNSGYVSIDGETVSSFNNWDSDSHAYRLKGSFPTFVELHLNNDWSVSQAYFRMAVLNGSISYSNISESPTGGMSGNPDPLVYTITDGWNH